MERYCADMQISQSVQVWTEMLWRKQLLHKNYYGCKKVQKYLVF